MDEELRLLERAAQNGDSLAKLRLDRARVRANVVTPIKTVADFDGALRKSCNLVHNITKARSWSRLAKYLNNFEQFFDKEYHARFHCFLKKEGSKKEGFQSLIVFEPSCVTIGFAKIGIFWNEELADAIRGANFWTTNPGVSGIAEWNESFSRWASHADPSIVENRPKDRVQAPKDIFTSWAKETAAQYRHKHRNRNQYYDYGPSVI